MSEKPRCGLCGKNTLPLTKTECCNNWICDDGYYYGLIPGFQSCMRNHERHTLCHSHFAEGHKAREPDWRKCNQCKEMFSAENYVWLVTNESNFNEPSIKYQISNCIECRRAINFKTEPHLSIGDNHYCLNCMLKPDKDSKAKKAQPKPQKRQSSTPRSKSTVSV